MTNKSTHPKKPMVPPPQGYGPALAWHNPTWWNDGIRPALTYVLPVLVAFLTFKDGGVGWMATWWWWPFLLGWTTAAVPYFRGRPFAAGATWFRLGRQRVNTFELVAIQVAAYYGFYSLKLEDADRHRLSTQFGTIRQDQRLWTLVYEGIRHSAHQGHLPLDRVTRAMLNLPVLHTTPTAEATGRQRRQAEEHDARPPATEAATTPTRPARPRWTSTLWALLPALTLGLATPLVVAHAAQKLHRPCLALAALTYALPLPVFLATAALAPRSAETGEWTAAELITGLTYTWLLGGLHAYRLRWRIFAKPGANRAREQILARRTTAAAAG